MGQDVIRWSAAVCSFAPHSHAGVGVIPHVCIVERNRPTPVRRQSSFTQEGLGKCTPGGRGPTSRFSHEAPSCHSVFNLRSAQLPAELVLKTSVPFSKSSAAGTKGRLDLSCRGQKPFMKYVLWVLSTASKRQCGSFRRSSDGSIPARTYKSSVCVCRKHPVTRRKASLIGLSMRRV